MSPFDLRGPEFLLFYFVLGMLMLAILNMLRQRAEPSGVVQTNLSDPYQISYLRGGTNELLRVATISLIHRGLLKVSKTQVSVANPQAVNGVAAPLERDLLSYFAEPKEASSVFSQSRFSSVGAQYDEPLERLGLLPDDALRRDRWRRLALALAIMWGIAAAKIGIALARGRTNIGFLILLSILFAFLAYRLIYPRMTRKGQEMLTDLRSLLSSLKGRASSASENWDAHELMLLAAVFGIAAVPTAVCPYVRTLYPAASSDSGGEFSGSSCGSSSCGGSSGCGGGGGCGGCGS
jgi:uncharacterized protein (TIGR04222 family)